ncbi:MAG: deoxyribonuclease IV [Candidatus Berkelbacteria bacterium]|nr:deoxyribonuclease IV [Candidatus Berkelbacteria bacterium]
MKLGAHISISAPFSDAISRASDSGSECMQIFVNAPQRWAPQTIPEKEIAKFVALNKKADINPIIIHSIYLINLASDNPFFYQASIKSLIDDMEKAEKIGALGVNFHLGSTKGKKFSEVLDKIVVAIKMILAATEKSFLILENSAGAGDIIGDKFEELSEIINAVKSDRLKVTLDTAHAFASGYNLATDDGLEKTLAEFDKFIGLEKLVCLHLNDSAVELGSNRDRHAEIGDGKIGLEAFRRIVNHSKLCDLPGIIETPGIKDRTGIDSLTILKSLRK